MQVYNNLKTLFTFASMKEQLTISQYAALTGVTRDTIHKRIKRGEKLKGVKSITMVGTVNILTVDKSKL